MGEYIWKSISDKGIYDYIYRDYISRIYSEFLKLNNNNQKKMMIKNWAKNSNRHFLEEDIQMANKNMQTYSTSLIIREMQIKTPMRFSFHIH